MVTCYAELINDEQIAAMAIAAASQSSPNNPGASQIERTASEHFGRRDVDQDATLATSPERASRLVTPPGRMAMPSGDVQGPELPPSGCLSGVWTCMAPWFDAFSTRVRIAHTQCTATQQSPHQLPAAARTEPYPNPEGAAIHYPDLCSASRNQSCGSSRVQCQGGQLHNRGGECPGSPVRAQTRRAASNHTNVRPIETSNPGSQRGGQSTRERCSEFGICPTSPC